MPAGTILNGESVGHHNIMAKQPLDRHRDMAAARWRWLTLFNMLRQGEYRALVWDRTRTTSLGVWAAHSLDAF